VRVRLAQVGNEVGLLPLQFPGIHLLAVGYPQESPGILEVPLGEPELRAAQDQGSSQAGVAHAELESYLTSVAVAQNERPLQTQHANQGGHVVCHQAVAEFARRVVGPAVTTTVRREDLEVLGEGRQVRRPGLRGRGAAVK
jgi:hypothetical protein